MNNQPIGVLDSGVGGLTVWKEIIKELPNESTIYIGDSKNAPYGKKTPKEIRQLASKLISFLLKQNVKLIVIACNTITVNGIDKLRQEFPNVPIIGTVPVIKAAVNSTKNKKIGLLSTEATAKSKYNRDLIKKFASNLMVITVATNKLVPLIEANNKLELKKILSKELIPFRREGVDVVILGSTHFPIIRAEIQKILGREVTVLDSGPAISRQVKRVLKANDTLSSARKTKHILYTTGKRKQFKEVTNLLVFDKGRTLIKNTTILRSDLK